MTQAFALEHLTTAPPGAPPAAPPAVVPDIAPMAPVVSPETPTRLPAEWVEVERVTISGEVIDRVVVGPNGVFAVHIDTDTRPVAIRPESGMYRAGVRTGDPVKRALRNTQALRAVLGAADGELFPYPVLVTASHGDEHRLGRLLVVRPGRLAEALWRHPSRPLTRSARRRAVDELRALAG
jgi:hypothetical protein